MKQQNISYQGNIYLLYLRSAIFQFNILLTSIIICPIMLAFAVAPFSVRYKLAALWVNFNLWSVKTFCGLHYHVEGLENILTNGNAIVLSKHQSAWETLALQQIFPPQVFLLKRELLWLPFWGWAMARLKPIAIDRKSTKKALNDLIEQGAARLNEGLWVVIFPEGTRIAPGHRVKFNSGGCLLAQRTGFPIIPVAHNAGEFWPRYSFLKFPGTIKVRIGSAIDPAGRKAHDINREVEGWITDAMRGISAIEAAGEI